MGCHQHADVEQLRNDCCCRYAAMGYRDHCCSEMILAFAMMYSSLEFAYNSAFGKLLSTTTPIHTASTHKLNTPNSTLQTRPEPCMPRCSVPEHTNRAVGAAEPFAISFTISRSKPVKLCIAGRLGFTGTNGLHFPAMHSAQSAPVAGALFTQHLEQRACLTGRSGKKKQPEPTDGTIHRNAQGPSTPECSVLRAQYSTGTVGRAQCSGGTSASASKHGGAGLQCS